ncbi:hypothetical protein TNCV_1502241 [Trichonephila clavipes]|uniref:Reverse transcriptase/retrotransposon-derived protein RNase H-like domain-containing protein n=1 Tax=Trichonephila clavipes TaxID=2585209 RepID=A0A8X6RWD1_TRICX|nr:hypothetical protein TNCV_1502241 [Trichonephila clavipes]
MYASSSSVNPTPLAHADNQGDVPLRWEISHWHPTRFNLYDPEIDKVVKTIEEGKVEIDLSKTRLEEKQKQELQDLFNSFQGLFSDKLRLTHVSYHEIDAGDKPFVVSRPHYFGREEIKTDETKVRAVVEMKPPRNSKEVSKFLEAQKAFDSVRVAITKAPVLNAELFTDASSICVGAVLNQEQRPVVFAFRTLSNAERNYTVTERERVFSSGLGSK